MYRNKKQVLSFALLFLSVVTFAQQKNKTPLLQVIDSALGKAVDQYKVLGKNLPPDVLPKTYYPLTKKSETSKSSWWCSGFYPGSLNYLYEYSHDASLWDEASRAEKLLEKEQFNKGTHDLGFMMYCSFGNANRLMPTKEYAEILMNSAKSLSTRFNPTVGCIQSWGATAKWKFPVIIDNMMNLELLFWATKYSGDSSFYKIAVTHANTTMKNHYRPDFSSWHVVDYDPVTGNVNVKQTAQGFADYSAWARGQSWGLYGYVVMYRSTKDPKYLAHANKIANFILNNPTLPADKIPYWDYNSTDIPATYRDASASAIMASALIELSKYAGAEKGKTYLGVAEQIIRNLSTRVYTAPVGENGGFILKHSTGHLPGGSEVDVPLTYADYYYIEAMMRYKALKGKK
jgi:unsaturated chondroitin disaccharide hydrolase